MEKELNQYHVLDQHLYPEKDDLFYNEMRNRLERLSEDDIMVFDIMSGMPQKENFITQAYILLICYEGKASCRIGEKVHDLRKGDLFIGQPQLFVENAMTSLDFKCKGLLLSSNYIESLFFLGGKAWDAKFIIKDNPVVHLSDEELEMAIQNNDFIRLKLESAKKMPHHKEIISYLLQSFIYEFYDTLVPKLNLATYSYTSAENLFSRFMNMALEETPLHREVSFYADRLCITPKYLSVICKQTSGSTASTILNNLSIKHIKQQLRTSSKTVKQIANEAGFDNLSFFGKYVKRELGMSPREYRLKNE